MDVLCGWFGWAWRAAEIDEGHATVDTVTLRYRTGVTQQADARVVEVQPSGLLDEIPGTTAYAPVWAQVYGRDCPCGLDALAGIFYCLSLYAEYGIEGRDAHQRIPSALHPLVARGVARTPVADALALGLAGQLWRAGGYLGLPTFVEESTGLSVDVDAPAAIAGRPWIKRQTSLWRGVVREGYHRDGPEPITASQVWRWGRGAPDPFDTFGYLDGEARGRNLPQDYFTLVGYGNRLDPGWRYGHPRWKPFWRKLTAVGRVGIHPSYHSSDRPELFEAEVRHLADATGAPVEISRQHFLRVRLPDTFRVLIALGIREEHSLMWADASGFRTGSSRSFPWYDLLAERATDLTLVPPHAMDVTARYYGGLSPKQAVERWTELSDQARAHGSGLRCIWHNSNLGPWYGWHPWRAAFEASLDLQANDKTTATR